MKVAIIMGSINDNLVMKNIYPILDSFDIKYEKLVVSAHRTPEYMYEFAKKASKEYSIIIAGAGGSAHLPGMVASLTTLPVIGVPIKSKKFKGIDSLLSIIQMPKGTPVATVSIDGSENAALLAVKILAINNKTLEKKLLKYKKDLMKSSKASSGKLYE